MGNPISFDLEKAREIARDHLRAARAPALQALDTEAVIAMGQGKSLTEIEAKKQVLRDLPDAPAIEQAQDIVELKAARDALISTVIEGAE